ncbi:hypothetical protein WJX75_006723 [Coccomyxa subellipsoidea]|uniref:MBD domain-containing protein n=1 Tax=Coccomyxa subellipsoidea TaxID=248742 RepID=A0ABR2YMV0_9CHLO
MSWCSDASEICKHCKKPDFQEGYGPRTLLLCDGCETTGSHVECEEHLTGRKIGEDVLTAGHNWYCSKECEKVTTELLAWSGRRIPLEESNYTIEFASLYDHRSKGTLSTVDTAKRLLKQSFDPLVMENGRDLIDMICTSYESPATDNDEDQYNFSNFRVVVMRKGAMCVSAATLRVFGTAFAEMPFIATREGYRRDGNLTRFMEVVEDRLGSLGVQYMIVPSLRQLLGMWRDRFGFVPVTLTEAAVLDSRIVSPDTDSAQLLKKCLAPRTVAAPQTPARVLRSGRMREASSPQQPPQESDELSPRQTRCQEVKKSKQAIAAAMLPPDVPCSAQPAAPPVRGPETHVTAQPAASGSSCKQSAAKLEGPFPVPELGPGWTKVYRTRPNSTNHRDTTYTSPEGQTFRSMKQASAHAEAIGTKLALSVVPAAAAVTTGMAATPGLGQKPASSAAPATNQVLEAWAAPVPAGQAKSLGQGSVMGMPVIPASAAKPQTRVPVMGALQTDTMPSAKPPLPLGPAHKAAQPPPKATHARGLMPPPPPRFPQPQKPGRQSPGAPRPSLQQQQVQQDAFIARGIAVSLRHYIKDFQEETLKKNKALAEEIARLRQENEQLRSRAMDTRKQAAEELHAKLGSVVSLVSAVCGSFSPHDTVGALLHNLQGVLAEIQQEAAQIAHQLSCAEPASQTPTGESADVLPGGPTELLSDPLKSPGQPGLKRKAAGETGSPAGWLWALPSKRQKTTHVLSMPSIQVDDDGQDDIAQQCEGEVSMDTALHQTALFCSQLGSSMDD